MPVSYTHLDGKVVSNDREVNGLEGINFFNQYILLQDKRVYDIETREIKEGNSENFKMIEMCIRDRHMVKEGETVETICTMYNSNMSLLMDYNDLSNLTPGEKILIPSENE